MAETKEFPTVLILDHRTGKYRCLSARKKLKISSLKATEIPITINLKVTIPEKPTLHAEGEIKLSAAQVANLTIAELETNNNEN